jgi:hypothetical protein
MTDRYGRYISLQKIERLAKRYLSTNPLRKRRDCLEKQRAPLQKMESSFTENEAEN